MELWQAVLTTCCTTLAGVLVTDIIVRIKTSGKKYRNRKKEEQRQEIIDIFKDAMGPIKEELKEVNQKIDSLTSGDLKVLKKANRDSIRTQLYDIYDKCTIYKTRNDMDTESELFDSYKALKGNHGCDARHERFVSLPIKEEYDVQTNHTNSHN